nr:Rpn family recombination-promoting nuclease/putative transposase [uncultured Anaerostipes sp.]
MAEKLKNKVTDGFQKGHLYGKLPPCIHVGILNFNQMIRPNYYHKFCLMDEKTKEIYSRKFQFHMLELKKLKYAKEKQKRKPLYQWAKLIAAQTWEELEQESKGNKYMERALEEMIKISQDEMERYLYLREEIAESDRVSQIQSAKRIGRKEGKKEGEILKLIANNV